MKLTSLLAALAVVCGSSAAQAQGYPSRPITMVVPFPAGGPTDTLGRIMSEGMRPSLGQTIVVENVTGAGSTIGVGRAAEAAPDGYTLSLGNWTSHMGAGALYPVQYDLIRDFEPISLLTFAPMLIVAKNEMPAKDAKDLIAWLKANPDKHRQPPSAQAAPRTYVDSISRIRPALASSSCPIVAGRRRCRIWWADRLTSCAPRRRRHSPMCGAAS